MQRQPPSPPLDRQPALIGVLLTLAAVAWVITARRMAGMDAGPWTDPGALGFYISTWVVMMAAMMLPSVAPVVLRYSDHQHVPGPHAGISNAGKTGLFVAGYLAVWAAAGLVGYALLEAGRSLNGGVFSWDRAGRWTAAGVLLVATLYQFTPAKRACLTRCRNARASRYGTSRDYRAPRDGGLRAGIQHGAWCLGCCWALMVALFALGAMSVAWMVLISVLIAGERLLPWRKLGAIGVAVVLAALTIGVAAAPSRVPLLKIPGGPTAMRAMGASAPTNHREPINLRGCDPKHPLTGASSHGQARWGRCDRYASRCAPYQYSFLRRPLCVAGVTYGGERSRASRPGGRPAGQ